MEDEHVLAIGLAGSIARGDVWEGSDLDIEVIVRGDHPFSICLKEEKVGVDFAYFGESQAEDLPYDIVPIYDSHQIIEEILKKRDLDRLRLKMINNSIEQASRDLVKAKASLDSNRTHSSISYTHQAAEEMATAFTFLVREAPSTRRAISRLELAMRKIRNLRLFEEYLILYNMRRNLEKAAFFYRELKAGYEEIWDHLKEKGIGPIHISRESTFQLFFRNRIEPVYRHDKRDFIWFAFHEFPFILQHFFKPEDCLDGNVFQEADLNKTPACHWVKRYKAILGTIPLAQAPTIYQRAQHIMGELRKIESAN